MICCIHELVRFFKCLLKRISLIFTKAEMLNYMIKHGIDSFYTCYNDTSGIRKLLMSCLVAQDTFLVITSIYLKWNLCNIMNVLLRHFG